MLSHPGLSWTLGLGRFTRLACLEWKIVLHCIKQMLYRCKPLEKKHIFTVSYRHYTVTITLRPWRAGCHWMGSGDRGAGTSPLTTSVGEYFLTGGEGLGETRGAGGGVSSCCMVADHSKWLRIPIPSWSLRWTCRNYITKLIYKVLGMKSSCCQTFVSTQGYSTYTISAPQLHLGAGEVLHRWEVPHT